jgi:hypothetical protein
MKKGYKGNINIEDIYKCSQENEASMLAEKLDR